MGLRRCHGRRLHAAVALLLLLAIAIGRGSGEAVQEQKKQGFMRWERAAGSRRRLSGPGSSPPSCRFRCGRCFPCQPIHVAIQPGRSMPLEYYPEAWRCKCGNKLFMP